eukprot:7902195-Ditylum_brightwellii.AAC.1
MTFFASTPAFIPDEDGFLTAVEDNNNNGAEDDEDNDTSLSDPSKQGSSEGSTISASLYGDNNQAGSLHSEEMQFLSANGTAEQLILAYPHEKHLINYLLL